MEVGPILSAMWRNKLGAALIALQIAVTLAVVVNVLFIINGRIDKINRPVGSDTENIFSLQTVLLSENLNMENVMRDDLERIRNLPGVQAAISLLTYLQSGSARAETYRAVPEINDDMEIFTNINYTDEFGLAALGVELIEGRFFRADEIQFITVNFNGIPPKVVVTESLGRKFFPDGNIAGRTIYYDVQGAPVQIIGVISDVATGWIARDDDFLVDSRYYFMLHPYVIYKDRAIYLVRTEPGLLASIMPEVEASLLASDPNRLIQSVYTQQEILDRSYANDHATMVILSVVMVLMVIITGLGIVGLASFSVSQRTRQIGTRRALGARKRDILRYFFIENILLTTMGVVLGGVLTYVVNYVLSTEFGGDKLDFSYYPSGVLILYVLGLVAVFGPARRASMIAPAIATRTV